MSARESRDVLNPNQACVALTVLLQGLATNDEAAASEDAVEGDADNARGDNDGTDRVANEDIRIHTRRSRARSPATRSNVTSPLRQVTFASESLDDVFSEFERDDGKSKRGSRRTLSFRYIARYRRKSEHVAGKAMASRIFRPDLSLSQWRPSVAARQDHVFDHSDHQLVVASTSEDEISAIRSRARDAPPPKRRSKSNVHLPLRVSPLGLSSLPLHESALANDFSFLADGRSTVVRRLRPLSIATIRERRMARTARKAPLLPPIDTTPFDVDFVFPSSSSDAQATGGNTSSRSDDAKETGSVFFDDSGSWIPRSRCGSAHRPPPFGLPLSPRLLQSSRDSFSVVCRRVTASGGHVQIPTASGSILSPDSSPPSTLGAYATRRDDECPKQDGWVDFESSAIGPSPNPPLPSDAHLFDRQDDDSFAQNGLTDISFSSDFHPCVDESSTPVSVWPMKELEQDINAHRCPDSDVSSPLACSRRGSTNSLADRASIESDVDSDSRYTPSFSPGWTFSNATISDQNCEIASGTVDASGHKLGTLNTTPRSSSVQHKAIAQGSRHQRLNSALWFGQSREFCNNGVLLTDEGLFVQSNRGHLHHDLTMPAESMPDAPAFLEAWQSLSAVLPTFDHDEDEFPTTSWTKGDDGSCPFRYTASAPASLYCEDVTIVDEIASQESRSLDDRTLRDILDEFREQCSERVIQFTKSELTTDMRTSCRSAMSHESANGPPFAHQEFDHYRRSLDRRVLELLKQDHAQDISAGRERAIDRESTDSEGELKSKFTIPGKHNHPSYLRLNGLNHQPLPTGETR